MSPCVCPVGERRDGGSPVKGRRELRGRALHTDVHTALHPLCDGFVQPSTGNRNETDEQADRAHERARIARA